MINKHPHNPLPYKCLSIFSPLKSLNKNNILPSAFLIFLFFIFNRAQADNYLGIPHQQDPDLVVCVLPTQWENGPNIKYTLKFNGWIRVIAHTNLISGNKNDGYFLSTTNPDTSSSDQLHVYYKGTSPVPICFSLSSNGMPDSLLLQVDRNKSYLSTDSMISAIFSDHDVFCREFRKYRRIEIITFNHNQTIRYSVLISRHHLRPMQPIRDKNINQKTVSYIHSIEHTHWPTVLELNSKLNQTCLLGITPTLFRYLYLSNGITETSAIQLTDAIGVASNFIKDLSEKKHNQPNTNRKELIKKNKKCKDDFADSIDTRLTEWENICFTEISQILANKAFQSLEKPKVNPYSRKLTEISSIESQESQKILTQENGSSLFQAIAESYSKPAIPADLIKALNNKGCSLVASC
ncbi:hypothetical protein [Endozoicomonas sp. Mp262]|uniref:hypothetical protein n=1 Tax=Endozoicomonas sp. Mp262 TaxID=2919499 RepID=UPI0021DB394A